MCTVLVYNYHILHPPRLENPHHSIGSDIVLARQEPFAHLSRLSLRHNLCLSLSAVCLNRGLSYPWSLLLCAECLLTSSLLHSTILPYHPAL